MDEASPLLPENRFLSGALSRKDDDPFMQGELLHKFS